MAGYGADLDETPRWRLAVLFIVIVILSLVGHIGLHSLQEYFRKHKRVGLKHTLQTLQDELFALGLITLLLITLQDQIVKICIDGNSAGDDYSESDYAAKNRRLLAGYGDYTCPKGQESFWSLTALHEIHILIFLIAVVHLVQAAFSMILASLRVRRWKKYEDRVCHDMVPLKRKGAIKPKGTFVALWIWSFFTQFSDSVDGAVYLAIRRFFLEKMELDDDFNFYTYVVDSMEEDFAKLVEFQWVMWLIAAIWILLPWQAYTIIWLPCVLFLILLVIGAKLQSVAISIATLAYTHYTPNFIPHKKRNKSILKKSASKIKDILSGSSTHNLAHVTKQQQNGTAGRSPVELKQMATGPKSRQDTVDIESQKVPVSQTADKSSKSRVAEYMAQTELLSDSTSLFWFGKPKIMLFLFQYIYFVSGLVTSLLILDEWRGQRINHLTGHAMYIVMIIVNVIMMVHAALFIIPSYAITVAAGAYGPENILRKALKRNINADLAKKLELERKSQNSIQDSDMESVEDTADSHHGHAHGHGHGHGGHGHGHGGGEMRINMLLEAMDHSQSRKKKMEEVPPSTSNKKLLQTIVSSDDAADTGGQSSSGR
eukprot:TRINITY_DN692_c0_g1_i4.p1 TRINITY_DN692_c0_g1~~TRINITY_DN692_c0_g1_i4.p1  ORF type:complete len:599 (+),score=72.04 TRINITY_DN692_c0_g1_i4:115-1911(+)